MAANSNSALGVTETLMRSLQDNPTVTLLGLLLWAFLAGCGVHKFFEERKLRNLRSQLENAESRMQRGVAELAESEAVEEGVNRRIEKLRKFLSPDLLKKTVTQYLSEFPVGLRTGGSPIPGWNSKKNIYLILFASLRVQFACS